MTNKSNKAAKINTNTFKSVNTATQTKMIGSIARRGNTLKSDTIALVNGFLLHYVETGDMSNAKAIHDTIASAYTKGCATAFYKWLLSFSNSLRYDEKEKEIRHVKGTKREIVPNSKGEQHFEVSFFDLVIENTRMFDLNSRIQSLLTQANKAIEDGKAKDFDTKDVEKLTKSLQSSGFLSEAPVAQPEDH